MAVIWWFVPIAFLWKPYIVAQQIWKASNPETKLTEGIEWKQSVGSRNIKLWWILGLSYISIAIIGAIFLMMVVGLDNYLYPEQAARGMVELTVFYGSMIGIPLNILAILSTLFFIRMIKGGISI
jgi:hypothetical protein